LSFFLAKEKKPFLLDFLRLSSPRLPKSDEMEDVSSEFLVFKVPKSLPGDFWPISTGVCVALKNKEGKLPLLDVI